MAYRNVGPAVRSYTTAQITDLVARFGPTGTQEVDAIAPGTTVWDSTTGSSKTYNGTTFVASGGGATGAAGATGPAGPTGPTGPAGAAVATTSTVAALGAATPAGALRYVSDAAGGATLAFANGTNWINVKDGTTIT